MALVLDALKAGQVDLTFTNATESRARDMDFTAALVRLELGYLVPSTSTMKATGDVDHAGVRVGVSEEARRRPRWAGCCGRRPWFRWRTSTLHAPC